MRLRIRRHPGKPRQMLDYIGHESARGRPEQTREGFIGKENDGETAWKAFPESKTGRLGDCGVRKYDYETGRFTSIDPLWEGYYRWSPYQYAGNCLIIQIDPNGYVIDTKGFYYALNSYFQLFINDLSMITGSIKIAGESKSNELRNNPIP